ncbi:radical SAM protein [Planctobacterium marinum]|uniref:radical SAM protein n=1 Tax=Planctobacterium marinum TaxID=1631968 RepID=UPI001E3AFCA6|nr:radical SAM protein [Planctobacterium marinum]MCC2608236.1 radical SAM protein [Planctobacterium marinum]
MFDFFIVIHGEKNNKKVLSLNSDGCQININSPKNYHKVGQYYHEQMKSVLEQEPSIKFMFYGKITEKIFNDFSHSISYFNPLILSRRLSDKLESRLILSEFVDVLPVSLMLASDCMLETLVSRFPDHKSFVAQKRFGAGGAGSYIIDHNNTKLSGSSEFESLVVSPKRVNSFSVNQHIVIGSTTILYPPSIQIIREKCNEFFYGGCDYNLFESLDDPIKRKIYEFSERISNWLIKIGYKGVIGVDYLVSENESLEFVELNTRFQSSTLILNEILASNRLPSVQEAHISAFSKSFLNIDTSKLSIPKGSNFYTPLAEECSNVDFLIREKKLITPDLRNSYHNSGNIEVTCISDGLWPTSKIESSCQPKKYRFSEKIGAIDAEGKLQIKPALVHCQSKVFQDSFTPATIEEQARLKFELFSLGLQISFKAKATLYSSRDKLTIRDGIAGGIELLIANSIHINVPIKESFSLISPFSLEFEDLYYLSYFGRKIVNVEVVDLPKLVGEKTRSGKLMESIGQVFTDRLSINPFRGCRYNLANKKGCKFCAVAFGPMSKKTDIEDIKDVVKFVISNQKDSTKHILISGGSPLPKQWHYYVQVVTEIRKLTDLPIYIMIEPPESLSNLDLLLEAGVNEIGINMEIWDDKISKAIMPGKGKVSRTQYLETLKYATKLWGKSGNVRSLLIVGLEPAQNTLTAVEAISKLGVMPILSPFRAVTKTALEELPTPSAETMYELWDKATKISRQNNQIIGPSCIACQNNTITMPWGDEYKYY